MEKRKISFSVDKEEYEDILRHARLKGHGGQFPASAFAYYALRQMMKKYPISDKEKAEYAERYGKRENNALAVQPERIDRKNQGTGEDV
jgi:hypothetical protein